MSIAEVKKRLENVVDFGSAERLPSTKTTPTHTWDGQSTGDTLTYEGHTRHYAMLKFLPGYRYSRRPWEP